MKTLLALLLVFPLSALAATVQTFEMDSALLKVKRNYTVLLPDSYNSDTNTVFPVLYLLHGMGDHSDSWFKNMPFSDIYEKALSSGEIKPMVIITVQAMTFSGRGGHGYFNQPDWPYQDFFFQEFMPKVEGQFRIRKDRGGRALSGDSMGGGGAISYAQQHPEMFSSVYAMSPWLNNDSWSPESEFGSPVFNLCRSVQAYDCTLFVRRCSEEKKKALRNVRWFVAIGDDDFFIDDMGPFYAAMRKAGIGCQLRVAEGNHSWPFWQTRTAEMLKFVNEGFTPAGSSSAGKSEN